LLRHALVTIATRARSPLSSVVEEPGPRRSWISMTRK
jgi:hypothetical protein